VEENYYKMGIYWGGGGCYNYKTTDIKIVNKIKKIFTTKRRVVRVIKLANVKKFKGTEDTVINAKTQSGILKLLMFPGPCIFIYSNK
jgi:hypothetical protein